MNRLLPGVAARVPGGVRGQAEGPFLAMSCVALAAPDAASVWFPWHSCSPREGNPLTVSLFMCRQAITLKGSQILSLPAARCGGRPKLKVVWQSMFLPFLGFLFCFAFN